MQNCKIKVDCTTAFMTYLSYPCPVVDIVIPYLIAVSYDLCKRLIMALTTEYVRVQPSS
jgi:hypothetical protein